MRRLPKDGPWMNKSLMRYPSKLLVLFIILLNFVLWIIFCAAALRKLGESE